MTPPPDPASQAWVQMRSLVLDDDRRREVAEALGLSFFRVKALRRLKDGPFTLRELAGALLTDAPYTTVVVADLAERGLVERVAHPTDRRAKLVRLTSTGAAAARRAELILDRPPTALSSLPPEDLAALQRILAPLARGAGLATD